MPDLPNLWPEGLFKATNMVLPVTILQRQALLFNEQTRNVIVASVETRSVSIFQRNNSNETKPAIVHTLKITAPVMGNYDFELVRLIQEQALPYPLRVHSPLIEYTTEVNTSEDLESALLEVFANSRSVATIQSLLLQSHSS